MNNLNKILILRIYTIPAWIILGIFGHILISKNIAIENFLLISAMLPVTTWIGLILLLERLHAKTDSRPKISSKYAVACGVLSLAVGAYFNLTTVPVFLGMFAAAIIYSAKTRYGQISPFLFLFRGVQEVGMLIIIFLIHNAQIKEEFAPILASTYLIVTARNLIGDIRDINIDFNTFPKRFGKNAAFVASWLLTGTAVLLINDNLIAIPLILVLLFIGTRMNAYLLHKLFVLSTSAYFINYASAQLFNNTIIANLLYIASIAIVTYDYTPRRSNAEHKGRELV